MSLLCFILTACSQQDVPADINILTGSPEDRSIFSPRVAELERSGLRKVSYQMSLDSIALSPTAQELRFFVLPALSGSSILVRIQRKDEKWIATASFFDSMEALIPVPNNRVHTDTLRPRIGWNRFLTRLTKTDFNKMRSWYEIPGYDIGTGFTTNVMVEIADKGRYCFLSYPNIHTSNPEWPEIPELRSVFRFIERQLGTSFRYVMWDEITNEVIRASEEPFTEGKIEIDTSHLAD